jgi:hypothetical protein
LELLVSGFSTSDRIQEAHMTAIHVLIEAMEAKLFSASPYTTHTSKVNVELIQKNTTNV